MKAFYYLAQGDFCKNITEFYQISFKNLPYITDFRQQLVACKHDLERKQSYACAGLM